MIKIFFGVIYTLFNMCSGVTSCVGEHSNVPVPSNSVHGQNMALMSVQ